MYEKYKKELSLAKNKLLAIDFFLEKDSDYIATFGNGTTWKIDFNGKWYDNYIYIRATCKFNPHQVANFSL